MPKISQQQIRRISANKTQKSAAGGFVPAVISAHFGYEVLAEFEKDGKWQQVSCNWRQNLGTIAVGDRAEISLSQSGAVIENILPRSKNTLYKQQGRKTKPIASNVEQIILVGACIPACQFNLVDRYLIAASIAGIPAAIVANKIDIGKLDLSLYRDLGLKIFYTSTRSLEGIDSLAEFCAHKQNLICGQSGVGKSSLIAALIPNLSIQTQAISAATGLGRHTTSNVRRYHLPAGGTIIDTPGVRGYSFPEQTPEQEIQTAIKVIFPDVLEYAQNCRFANCQHLEEPDCGIKAAIAKKKLSLERWESFLSIYSRKLT